MFKKKSRPELYEIFKSNKPGNGTAAQAKSEINSIPALTAKPEPKQETHIPAPPVAAEKPYPKYKISFRSDAQPKEKGNSVFNKYIIPILLVIAIAVVIYLVVTQIKKQPSAPAPVVNTNPTAPRAPTSFWSNRMDILADNPEGRHKADDTCTFLKEKGIKDVFTKQERVNNIPSIIVYAGKHAKIEDARNERPKLKQLHSRFKNIDIVEVK